MARKIGNAKSAEKKQADDAAAVELDTLHPERTLIFGARKIVVREYGGIEWLRLLPTVRPLIDALAGLIDCGTPPTYEVALELFSSELDAILPAVAQAADINVDDIATLDPNELDVLLMTWWGANGRFFIARATSRVLVSRQEARIAQSAGAKSTPPSSPTDIPSQTSADTPAGS